MGTALSWYICLFHKNDVYVCERLLVIDIFQNISNGDKKNFVVKIY